MVKPVSTPPKNLTNTQNDAIFEAVSIHFSKAHHFWYPFANSRGLLTIDLNMVSTCPLSPELLKIPRYHVRKILHLEIHNRTHLEKIRDRISKAEKWPNNRCWP